MIPARVTRVVPRPTSAGDSGSSVLLLGPLGQLRPRQSRSGRPGRAAPDTWSPRSASRQPCSRRSGYRSQVPLQGRDGFPDHASQPVHPGRATRHGPAVTAETVPRRHRAVARHAGVGRRLVRVLPAGRAGSLLLGRRSFNSSSHNVSPCRVTRLGNRPRTLPYHSGTIQLTSHRLENVTQGRGLAHSAEGRHRIRGSPPARSQFHHSAGRFAGLGGGVLENPIAASEAARSGQVVQRRSQSCWVTPVRSPDLA